MRFCRLFLRRGPDLTITLSSDEQFASAHPVIFSAQFSILPVRLAIERHRGYSASESPTCPMECTMRNEHRSCRLTSPGYPSVYPRGIRCARSTTLSPLTRVHQSFERTVCQDNKPPSQQTSCTILLSYAESSLIMCQILNGRAGSNVLVKFIELTRQRYFSIIRERENSLNFSEFLKLRGESRAEY